jgi:SAM-dependent methyltransferase
MYGTRYNEWLYRARKSAFRRTIRSLGDVSKARVLDVGSGTGFYLDLWHRAGVTDLTGSDLTENAVSDLRRRFDVPVVRLDITAAEPAAQPFDIVSAFDILFHIVDDELYAAAFRNLAAQLKPGGILIFSEHLPRRETNRERHRVSRSLDSVLETAARAGFSGFDRKPMLVLMDYPIDATPGRGQVRRWRMIQRLAQSEWSGFATGLLLYPFERLLTRVSRESPTTEIVVCRRTA